MRAMLTLAQRELLRFARDRSRVVGALLPPIVFWALIGSGLGTSFVVAGAPRGIGYLEYFFPGTVLLIVLFTAIFATISLIEDRREGFLQGVLVAPISRASLVAGKILGASTIAFAQGLAFLLLSPVVGLHPAGFGWVSILASLLLSAVGLTGLGFFIAWRLDSTQGFHAVMNLFLLPMWLLSGALFPASGAAGWIRALMMVNPMTYALAGVQEGFYGGGCGASFFLNLSVLSAFAAAMFLLSVWAARSPKAP